jgi:serine/threonine protein kinase
MPGIPAGDLGISSHTDGSAASLVPDYELLQRIGAGAYGEVWLARSVLGQLRAIKLIFRSRFAEPRPFDREFEGIQLFEPISRSHPSQLAILHVGKNTAAGCFYYVMELADDANAGKEGQLDYAYAPKTLRQELERCERLPIRECVQAGLSLATALGHLHRHGLVHRDIKPSNVVFVNGVAKLGDIGLVTEAGDTQSIVGTEGYLPPEGPGTPQADIFSLGKVLYEISTGLDRRRFPELPEPMRSWADYREAVEFNEIILKACAAQSGQRYQSAEELHRDLLLVAGGRSVRKARMRRRYAWAAGLAALLSLAAALSQYFWITAGTHGRTVSYLKSTKPEVDNLVKQGHDLIRFESPDQIEKAIEKFKAATNQDPTFAPAYNGLFHAYVHWGNPMARQGLQDITLKLRQLRPDSSEALQAAAFIKWQNWDFRGALQESTRAVAAPAISLEGDAYKYLEHGFFLEETGDSTNALRFYQLAHRLLPHDPIIIDHVGQPFFMQRRFSEAGRYFKASVDEQQDHLNGHIWLAKSYEETDRWENAIDEWRLCDSLNGIKADNRETFFSQWRLAARQRGAQGYWQARLDAALADTPRPAYDIATFYAHLGNKEKSYAFLEEACQARDIGNLMVEVCWDHTDPQFLRIVRKYHLIP